MTPNWITTAVERARSRRPVTWLTLIGVLLLPVVIGGILVTALYNPVDRLESLTAAVVNEDEPVTVDGQTVPLGRQLTAGLVDGSDDLDSNLTWTLSNADDAADGLADGTYAAVITIPENFSAAALSTRPGETPEQATIEVTTPPDSLIVDDAITAQVANAAATTMGTELSTVYLENVFLGFTTLSDQLGTAADGAQQLADGAAQAADGAAELPGGISQLADGNTQLASGASQLADGAGQLADGATSLQSGLTTISDKTGDAAAGAQQLADGVTAGAQTLEDTGLVPDQVSGFADTAAASTAATAEAIGTQAATLGALAAQCAPVGSDFCLQLATAAADTGAAAQQAVTAATDAGTTQYALDAFDTEGTAQFAGQFREIGSGVGELAGGLTQLAGGIDQSAAGAGQLATGATGVQDGAAGLADGASQLASGATQAADGATSLADGVAQLADGTDELAGGLATAADSLPSYSDAEATDLATVVADPVSADGVGTSLFGASAIPLLTTLALWFGGLGTFIALQAVSRRALTSRQPSAVLALRSFAPAAGLGALQGLLVAGVVQLAASYSWAEWSVFALVCVVAGIAFAAVNQALVAVFGGAGRWVSALIGVFVVATGVVSTVPGALSSIAGLLPTGPAYNGMVAALTSATGLGAALTGLVVWTLIALGATVLVVARRRSTSAQALLKATPLTA
ncbi:putative membrane protein [Microbacterium terrae]|uniref:ABC-2 family transporter protein n=1 Tax=Microbacterium terrae TaxID=69369 RepID=A0A0M2GUU4_9MICO|nr:YhgE/Pip family protein [Microbacterium terrae]KJL37451.1 ABC-2 family transporter protein [Microbacterium terrae]MBP1076279.1 putative membrane protein [Microbacterium terrae]GLJ97101.1 membrane protein [Microbacterium terrae]